MVVTMELTVEVTRTLTWTVMTSTSLWVLVAWAVFVEVTVTLLTLAEDEKSSAANFYTMIARRSPGDFNRRLTRKPRTSHPNTYFRPDNIHRRNTSRQLYSRSPRDSMCPPPLGNTMKPRLARSSPRSRDTSYCCHRSRSCFRSQGIAVSGARESDGRSRVLCRSERAKGLRRRQVHPHRLSRRQRRFQMLERRRIRSRKRSSKRERRRGKWSRYAS